MNFPFHDFQWDFLKNQDGAKSGQDIDFETNVVHTVDGWNPAFTSWGWLVVYPIIYGVLYIPRWYGISSINSSLDIFGKDEVQTWTTNWRQT